MKEYYTYAYLREDGTPYYIGKGCGRRAYSSNHRINLPPKDRIIILKRFYLEEDAYSHEEYMIFVFGCKYNNTGILQNLCDGGNKTTSGFKHTPEECKRRKDRMKGNKIWLGRSHGEECRRKVSDARKGKSLSKDHIDKLKKSHSLKWKLTSPTGEIFVVENLTQWCRDNNLNPSPFYTYGKHKGWAATKLVTSKCPL